MKIVDARGKLCPQPLMMTRKAIMGSSKNEEIEIVMDNETACSNVETYLTESNVKYSASINNGEQHISFVVDGEEKIDVNKEIVCPIPEKINNNIREGYVVAIKSEYMGDGDIELGALLLRAYINTLSETDFLPTSIILYNSGVKIALSDRDTSKSLEEMEKKGVELILCGTCIDFYKLKQKVKIGKISNMFVIADKLSKAINIVYP
ncbi:MAG: sulfurtransferase-like selenium metabolism protein YedF [Bacteroidetes bacterium]|nr:sulfurtransferase-like selenium metabolism protein YedF [Bacteroidota bacterium]